MMNSKKFTKGVENLVNPMDVGALHFIQPFNKLLPKFVQDKFMKEIGRASCRERV